jgi:hypothetical protein
MQVSIAKYGGLPPIVSAITAPDLETARMACCACANLCEVVENMDTVVDAGAIPSLVVALGSAEPMVAREAARALGNLCANYQYGDMVLRAQGALSTLTALLRSDEPPVQRMAAMALCNLSGSVRNQPKMLKAGLLDPVVSEARQSLDPKSKNDHETIRYCLLVLANLAVCRENHPALMGQSLDVLAGYSKHRDVKCRQHAVFALGNLCANEANLDAIVQSGALKTLITYAFPSTDTSTNVQFQAIAALRGISTHPGRRVQVVRDGALEALVLAARSTSAEVQRETAAVLANLALAEENKVAMARGGVLPALCHLLSCADNERGLHAVCAIANMAEMVEGRTHRHMIDEGCLRPLLRQADGGDAEVRKEVSRCLALFASKRDSQSALLSAGALPRVVSFLSSNDTVERRFGALTVGNLAIVTQNHGALFESGAVAALLEPHFHSAEDLETRRCTAFALNNIASYEPNHRACERMGLLRPLCKLLSDADRDTHLQAAFGVRQLSITARCRAQFLDMGGLQALLRLGSAANSVEVHREVAAALRNVSLSESTKIQICREGGLTVLIELMHSADIETAHQATGVVANLAEVVENQGDMLEAGVLQHMKFVMRSTSLDVQREAVRAISNLSAEHAYTAAIAGAGAIVPLVAMLSSPDFLCQRFATMGVANLATNLTNQEKVLHEGALQPLLNLARRINGDLETQRYAVFALTNVAATRSNHAMLVDSGVAELVVGLLDDEDIEIRNSAAFCVANLASNTANHAALLDEGVLGPIIGIVASDDSVAQLRAVCAIRGLSVDEAIRQELLERGALPPLLRLMRSEDVEIQMEVLATLCNMSLSGCIGSDPQGFLRAVDSQNLVSFLCSADVTYRLFGAVALGNIASDLSLQGPLVRSGALGPLVSVANAADLETQRCIAFALCNLSADPNNRRSIVVEGGLPPLISLGCCDEPADRLAAVSTLRALASDAANRRDIIEAGALEALSSEPPLECSQQEGFAISRECASAICALTLNELNKLDVAKGSSLGRLMALARGQDAPSRRHALGALANLSENESTQEHLLEAGLVELLAELCNGSIVPINSDAGLHREAARCMANLSSNIVAKAVLQKQEGVSAAVCRLLEAEDYITSRFAAIGSANLALVDALPTLVKLAGGEGRKYVRLNEEGELDDEDDPLREPETSERMLKLLGYDMEARRYACLALGQIAANEGLPAQAALETPGSLEALRDCLSVDDTETAFNAAFTCNRLAVMEGALVPMGRVLLTALLELLEHCDDLEALGQAVAAVRRLVASTDNAIMAVRGGILRLLPPLCSGTRAESVREAAGVLCNLAVPHENKAPIASSPALEPLLTMCQSADVEVARLACGAVANCAEDTSAHLSLLQGGAVGTVRTFVHLMRSRHLAVHREAGRACGNLMSTLGGRVEWREEAGLPAALQLAKSLDAECQYNAALVLRKACADEGCRSYLVGGGGISTLIALLQIRGIDTQLQTTAALRDLGSDPEYKQIVAGEGGLAAIVAVARSDDMRLRALALSTLRHLSISSLLKRSIVEAGALGPMLVSAEHFADHCAGTVANLAEDPRNQASSFY